MRRAEFGPRALCLTPVSYRDHIVLFNNYDEDTPSARLSDHVGEGWPLFAAPALLCSHIPPRLVIVGSQHYLRYPQCKVTCHCSGFALQTNMSKRHSGSSSITKSPPQPVVFVGGAVSDGADTPTGSSAQRRPHTLRLA